MPRFFFDTHNGDVSMRDTDGRALPDREAARIEGLKVFPDLTRDEIPAGDWRAFYVNVRDESGRAIYTACLTLVGRWLD